MTKSNKRIYIVITIITLLVFIILPAFITGIIQGYDSSLYLQEKAEWMGFLGSYLGSIIAGVFTVLAVLLSFEISKEHAENAVIKENALIVYYDLTLGLKDLARICGKFEMSLSTVIVPTKMFFSKEWIKNVSSISSIFKNTSSVEKLYLLYGDLEMLNKEIQIYSEHTSNCQAGINLDKVKELSSNFAKKYFKDWNSTIVEHILHEECDLLQYLTDDYRKALSEIKKRAEVLPI